MIIIAALLFFNLCYASDTDKLVSLSYGNIVRCYPELVGSNSLKVDLNKLKELIDQKYTTVRSALHHRVILFRDYDGKSKRLKHTRQGQGTGYDLSVEVIDLKGNSQPLRISEAQRINPKPVVVNSFLLGATLNSDESVYDDTKVNGLQLSYRSSFKNVQELQLTNKALKKSLSCENQKDLGIICSCEIK